MKPILSRRNLLTTGALGVGGWLFQPLLRQLTQDVHGQSMSGKRFVFYVNRLGVEEEYRPTAAGGSIELGAWAPLAPYLDELTIVNHMYCPFNLHLHGSSWFASGLAEVDDAPGGPTFDRYLARTIGADTPIRSLNIAAYQDRRSYLTVSADGLGTPFPSDGAEHAYARVFGGADNDDAQREVMARLRRDLSVLDFAVDDIHHLRTRLGSLERARLDQYATSIRELEMQLQRVNAARGACEAPAAPDPEVIGASRDDRRQERIGASIEVLTHAMTCGFTRVGTFYVPSQALPFLGEDGEIGDHQMWHGAGTPAKRTIWYRTQAEQIAAIWEVFKNTPEGDGTMADNTILLWMNEAGGRHHNGSYGYWAMVLGTMSPLSGPRVVELPMSEVTAGDVRRTLAGGSSRAPDIGDSAPVHAVNDLFVTLGQLLGAGTTEFGDSRLVRGPLPLA
ncbi:MAG: DUF1552 domain-containing protein [Myxococcota bacterium]